MRVASIACCLALIGGTSGAWAAGCPGNPHALGTSRTLSIKQADYPRIGIMQYSQLPQLPLADREVVLSFDDGPMPPYTDAVLKALANDCVKATFFMVGRQANAYPDAARRVHAAGHSIGTHSQNHPLTFDQMSLELAQREIDDGIASASSALGEPRAVAPFFRIPGLLRTAPVEDYLASRGITIWSSDFDADDWYKSVAPQDIVRKAMTRLDAKGRGILLLHDVQPATALALPQLLRELKARGYRVVHVVPYVPKPVVAERSGPARHETTRQGGQGWPRVAPSHASRRDLDRRKSQSDRRNPPRTAQRWYYYQR